MGVGIGALVGAVVGGAIESTTYEESSWFGLDKGQLFLIGAAEGLFLGVLAGAVVGALIKTESWEPLVIPATSTTPGPVKVGLRWSPSWLGEAR